MTRRRTALQFTLMTAAIGLIALCLVVLACAPAAPLREGGANDNTPTPAITVANAATGDASDPVNTPTAEPTATEQTDSGNTDPCRTIVAEVGRPVAPYVFGERTGSRGAAGGASGATGGAEPTITVAETEEIHNALDASLNPPTIENMTQFHDLVVHGYVESRTDLLYSADGENFVYGFVNVSVKDYIKGSGDKYICVTDSPEMDPHHKLYTGQEYIMMLFDESKYTGGLHKNTYEMSGAIGWQVDGNIARLLSDIPEPWVLVITTDRRVLDAWWLTPEPVRTTNLGKGIDLATLTQQIKAADVSQNP